MSEKNNEEDVISGKVSEMSLDSATGNGTSNAGSDSTNTDQPDSVSQSQVAQQIQNQRQQVEEISGSSSSNSVSKKLVSSKKGRAYQKKEHTFWDTQVCCVRMFLSIRPFFSYFFVGLDCFETSQKHCLQQS